MARRLAAAHRNKRTEPRRTRTGDPCLRAGLESGCVTERHSPTRFPARKATAPPEWCPTRGDRVHAGRSAMVFFFGFSPPQDRLQDRCADLWPTAAGNRSLSMSSPGLSHRARPAPAQVPVWNTATWNSPRPILARRPRKACASKGGPRWLWRCPGIAVRPPATAKNDIPPSQHLHG